MLDEKIIFLRTHENVQFGGKHQNNFSTEDRGSLYKAVEIKPVFNGTAVQIKNADDCLIIPMVNICFLRLESEVSKAKAAAKAKEAAKPKTNIKPHEIKRPR